MNSSLSHKIDQIASSAPLSLESVDFTMQNPTAVKQRLGDTFRYFQLVEGEVAAEPLNTLMPRLSDRYRGYKSHAKEFISYWVPEETRHGEIFDKLLAKLDVPTLPQAEDVTLMHKLGGKIGELSMSVHAIFEYVYHTRGAMHERLTATGYKLMQDILSQLGENALVNTLVVPIRKQESRHLGYYKQAAVELKPHLHDWQLYLARKLSIATYKPVGVSTDAEARSGLFGGVALALAGEHVDQFTAPIQQIAQDLLSDSESRILPQFVKKAFDECIDLHTPPAAIAA